MRAAIFGLGGAQVALTGARAGAIGHGVRTWPGRPPLFAGLALSLSSTAFALQILEEKGELALRHGRLAFAVLLFQDLAAIPADRPAAAVRRDGVEDAAQQMELCRRPKAIGVIVVVVVVGRYLLDGIFRLVARTRVKEAMTASALLTVVGVTLVMEQAGLSASLGAFIAGVLLANSHYRHEIEADIAALRGPAARPILHRRRHVAQPRPDRREPVAGRRPWSWASLASQERHPLRARPPGRA